MIWEVPGITVGHSTDSGARTGCTVVLADPAAVASGEVRGGAPATREFALLDPAATMDRVDAVVLSGGSAFGLACSNGVVCRLEELGRGFETPFGRVPVVVGMSLFDLGVGDPGVRPTEADGRSATDRAATSPSTELGTVGAGAGATVSSWRRLDPPAAGGLGGAVRRHGDLVVAVLAAVNPWGDVVGSAQADDPEPDLWELLAPDPVADSPPDDPDSPDSTAGTDARTDSREHTTIGVIATNAALDKAGCHQVCRGAHDGLARALTPPHGSMDGDGFVAMATGEVDAPVDLVRWMAVEVVDEAVRSVARR